MNNAPKIKGTKFEGLVLALKAQNKTLAEIKDGLASEGLDVSTEAIRRFIVSTPKTAFEGENEDVEGLLENADFLAKFEACKAELDQSYSGLGLTAQIELVAKIEALAAYQLDKWLNAPIGTPPIALAELSLKMKRGLKSLNEP
jgi:hypothetical protein